MDNDAAVWNWIGHYLWAPLMAVMGGLTLILWKSLNKSIEGKASTDVFKDISRLEKLTDDFLDRRSFEEYVRRNDQQRTEDRYQANAQYARLEVQNTALLGKVDRLTSLVLGGSSGRRAADDT